MVDQYVDAGVPFLRSQNITPFRIATENIKFITPEFHERIRKSALRPGDVAVVRTGYPGTAAVVPASLGEANCADLVVITPGPQLDSRFLAAIFNSSWGVASVGGNLVGSAQQHFNVGAAKHMEVRLPPITIQQKIAGVLTAYDALIDNNMRRIKLFEELAQRIYREWFVEFRYPEHRTVPLVDTELGCAPQGWSVEPLFAVADVAFGFAFKSTGFNEEHGTPVVRIRDIPNGESRTLTTEDPGDQYRIRDGDILIGMDGDFHMGRWSAGEAWLNQRVTRVRPATPGLSTYSLYMALEDPIARWNEAIVGTTVAHLGKRHLERISILIPPAPLREATSRLLDPILSMEITLRKANRQLRASRDLLLPRLIAGDLELAKLTIDVDTDAS